MHARDVLLVGIWRAVPFKDASEAQKNRRELHNQYYATSLCRRKVEASHTPFSPQRTSVIG